MAKIYLSATYADLKVYRDAVYRILRMLRHDVISMEDYVATDAYPLHKCLADVAACEIYVGLLGWRYGYCPDRDNPEQRSITELEYRQAGTSGLPRLMFLVDKEAEWPDEFRDLETGAGDNGRQIAELRAEIETEQLVSHFRTPDQLAGLVSVAVQQCQVNESIGRSLYRSKIAQVKSRALEQRVNALLEDYQAATEQLAYTSAAVDQNRLRRQIAVLERDISQLENEIVGFSDSFVEDATQVTSTPSQNPTPIYSGKTKVEFCRRLGDSWRYLASVLEIPPNDQDRFTLGDQACGIWVWLDNRTRLEELPAALDYIGRSDLASLLRAEHP